MDLLLETDFIYYFLLCLAMFAWAFLAIVIQYIIYEGIKVYETKKARKLSNL
jgi:uncharacterized membrane protein YjfL (UPF0719 family)